MKNKKQTQNNTERNDIKNKLLLFPGEVLPFDEKLLPLDILGFSNNQFISKRFGILRYNKETEKPLVEDEDEIFRSLGKYYSPRLDDFVIGTITQKTGELYRVDIGTYTNAILLTTEFEGATKKTKPNLNVGDVVFARVNRINKFDAPMISCISQINSKNWTSGETFFGNLKDGNLFTFPKNSAWEFYKEDNFIVKRMSDVMQFEFAVGMNGKIWINSESVQNILQIYDVFMKYFTHTQEDLEKYFHNTFVKNQGKDKKDKKDK